MSTHAPQSLPSVPGVPAKSPLRPRRIAFAFLITPLLAPFYAAILFGEPRVLPWGLIASYPAAVLIGLPAIVWLAQARRIGWWQCALTGICCSVPIMITCTVGVVPWQIEPVGPVDAAGVLAWGAFSGLSFWLLGIAGDTPVTLRTILTGMRI